MPNTPKEGLTPSHAIHTQTHRDAEHVRGIQEGRDDTGAALNAGALADGFGDALWVSTCERAVRAQWEVDAHVGEGEESGGCERYRAVFVVRIETGLGGLLPARRP